MRALPVPVVLTSMVLTGWLTGAAAQDTGSVAPPGLVSAAVEQGGVAGSTRPGVIPQPTENSPGLVWGITLGELYTDNLKLAASGKPKETSWITVIQPFVKSAWSTPRFSGMLDYTLNGYVYAGQSNDNQLAQKLDARGTFAILPQHFFIDGTARYGRAIINNESPAGSGTFFLDNNQANVAMATLSPYWVQDLGEVGTMILRYTRGRVIYNRRGIPEENSSSLVGVSNVTSDAVQLRLVSPEYETWGWNAEYSEQHLSPDSGQSISFAIAQAGVSRQIGPEVRLQADVGKENRYLPDGTSKYLGASFWDVGVQWSNTLNSFKLLVGHRFYGRSGQFDWTHTGALLTTVVSYEERPTDLNQRLLGENPGSGAPPPIGFPRIPSLADRRVYLMKRASASAYYEMPKGRLSLRLYDESRKFFLLGGGREKVANADVAWRYDMGPFTTLTPTVGWQRYQFLDGQIRYMHYLQMALVHQFNPDNFASLRLRNDSSNVYSVSPGSHGFRVNVIYLQWTHLFKD